MTSRLAAASQPNTPAGGFYGCHARRSKWPAPPGAALCYAAPEGRAAEEAVRAKHPDLETTIERRCPDGHAQVLRCYPLRRAYGRVQPFPTLFWLACEHLDRQLARLERGGAIALLERALAADESLRAAVLADHRAYSEERWRALREEDRRVLEERALAGQARTRGIGGIRDFSTVKCLHLHYAHHLARGSAIGRWLESAFCIIPCGEAGP
ncbi:MAG: DUF501 domain-containing protein [Planctomycetes bacterium]|nr:DUF501 domain-containing protein [Planctomycetota bacterium]